MTLREYTEFAMYDAGVQLVKLRTYLQNLGIKVRLDIYKKALFVFKNKNDTMYESPVFKISFDVDTYDVPVLTLKTCSRYSMHPYLIWLWTNLSLELKASMMKSLLEDPENGPKKC